MPNAAPDSAASVSYLYLSEHNKTKTSPDEPDDSVIELRAPSQEDLPFTIAVDDAAGAFVATTGGVEFGAVTFAEKDDKLLLLATSILPEYRGRGLATALMRTVLERVRAEGRRATVQCPVLRSFIEQNPEYEALLGPDSSWHGPQQ